MDSEFETFLSQFKCKVPPIDIAYDEIEEFREGTLIEGHFVNLFLFNNDSIRTNEWLNLYKYYSLYKFKFGNYLGLIVKENGGAGGVEERIYLMTFNSIGQKISQLKVAGLIGDCSYIGKQNCKIDLGYFIHIENITYEGSCDDDIYLPVFKDTVYFTLDDLTGTIRKK